MSVLKTKQILSLLAVPASIAISKLTGRYCVYCDELATLRSGFYKNAHPSPNIYQINKVIPKQLSKLSNYLHDLVYNIVHRLQRVWRVILRCIYLSYIYAPAFVTSPFVLFPNIANPDITKWWWSLFRSCIIASGPCSLKFSQWIATRPDLFHKILCDELKSLQTKAISPSTDITLNVLKQAMGSAWGTSIIPSTDAYGKPIVIGSGCVAQVVKGIWKKSTGNRKEDIREVSVVFKVVHPDIKSSIEADIDIMQCLSYFIECIPGLRALSLSECVHEFSHLMMNQLDMTVEANNLKTFRKNFKSKAKFTMWLAADNKPSIIFPEPIDELTSENVLVETFESGRLMCNMIVDDSIDVKIKHRVALLGLHAILKMVFEDNFIHADLHPGNILVNEQDPSHLHLCLIDAGIVAELSLLDRRNLIDLFRAVISNEGCEVGNLMIERSRNKSTVIDGDLFSAEMGRLVDEVHGTGLTLGQIGISSLLQKVLVLCYKHQVKLESRFASVILAIGIVEGLGRRLDPNINILEVAGPYIVNACFL